MSLNAYIDYLAQVSNISRPDISFCDFSRQRLQEYMKWMSDTKAYAPKTINLRLTAIKSFLKYCSCEDITLVCFCNDVQSLKGVKTLKKPIYYMTREATMALLGAPPSGTVKQRRNKMILILMYDSAARIQEIADLTTGSLHIDRKHPFIILVGKGGKIRSVPIMQKTVTHLKSYLKEFHAPGVDAPLFYSNRYGTRCALSTDSIDLILKKAATFARLCNTDIPDDIHCHLVRKTRAMNLYQEGVPLPIVMQILGHESIATTSGFYAFATLEMIYAEMEKAHPNASAEIPKWKEKQILDALYSLD
jgi:site-specific recombinase XerD